MRRIAVDIGGTFTDVVYADEHGRLSVGKALTTRERIFEGIREALEFVAKSLETEVRLLLSRTDLFIYSTTWAINAIVEGKTAKTAVLVTEGFPNVSFRAGGRTNAFDFSKPNPKPYVPRRLAFEIRERIDSEGCVFTPFDESQARDVLRRLRGLGIEAVAVSLLWSILNPDHELALGRLIEEELPGVPYTLGHQLNPILRENRRSSSATIDASLKPLMQGHLRELEQDLRAQGFDGELLGATSLGGAIHLDDLARRPVYSLKSGPAMGPVAARVYAAAENLGSDLVVCDTGGTSFDVSLVRNGRISETRQSVVGAGSTRVSTGLASVDVRSIGAGGGSIAWVDPGGLLRVGPMSAGSDPGPACYGRGGTRPTVTDAAVVLGYLDPQVFLGGRMALDPGAAARVLDELADALGIGLERAAHSVLVVVGERMVSAIQGITINEGVDPRDGAIVAGGGAAGLNIVPIARELGCRRVLVPRTAGALSACGGQHSDIIAEFNRSKPTDTRGFAFDEVNATLSQLERDAASFADGLRRRGLAQFHTDFSVEARYPHQVWELEVSLARPRFDGPADIDALVEAFHAVHERVFAVTEPGQQVECVDWKVRLTAALPHPPLERVRRSASGPPKARTQRSAFFAETGRVEVPRYRGEDLAPGVLLEGPSVIEEPNTTVVVYPGSRARVTELGGYLLEVD
ncbi:MAG: hydantoinase/oxoprolinase family protein [Myxococcota bacterium]